MLLSLFSSRLRLSRHSSSPLPYLALRDCVTIPTVRTFHLKHYTLKYQVQCSQKYIFPFTNSILDNSNNLIVQKNIYQFASYFFAQRPQSEWPTNHKSVSIHRMHWWYLTTNFSFALRADWNCYTRLTSCPIIARILSVYYWRTKKWSCNHFSFLFFRLSLSLSFACVVVTFNFVRDSQPFSSSFSLSFISIYSNCFVPSQGYTRRGTGNAIKVH